MNYYCEMWNVIINIIITTIWELENWRRNVDKWILFLDFFELRILPPPLWIRFFCHYTKSWNWCVLYNEYFEINFKKAMVYYDCILKYYLPILYFSSSPWYFVHSVTLLQRCTVVFSADSTLKNGSNLAKNNWHQDHSQ